MHRHTNLQTTGDAPLSARGRLFLFVCIVAAAFAAFVVSFVWYMAFASAMIALRSGEPDAVSAMSVPAWLMLAELARNLILATMLAHFAAALKIIDLRGASRLGILLWIGFPAMILAGSVMWENVPWMLAAIHSGDWLIKLLLIAAILTIGQQRNEPSGTAQPANVTFNRGGSR